MISSRSARLALHNHARAVDTKGCNASLAKLNPGYGVVLMHRCVPRCFAPSPDDDAPRYRFTW
jgi:hypothetical protein